MKLTKCAVYGSSIKIERQAVLIIHGIGDQKPTDTLRGFVKTIAPAITNSNKPRYFSKPDHVSATYELRRMTANGHSNSYKTDYFEFYWAHMMQNTKPSDFWWWFKHLMFRRVGLIPSRLQWIYWFTWLSVLLLVAGAIAILFLLPNLLVSVKTWQSLALNTGVINLLGKFVLTSIFSLILLICNYFIVEYIGDAARYTTPTPRNIAERQAIRQAGLDMLKKLHEKDSNGKDKYDRIVVVSHSLGSMVAYDLLNLYWGQIHVATKETPLKAFKAIEKVSHHLEQSYISHQNNLADTASRDAYEKACIDFRTAQFDFWKAQHGNSQSWHISDFITIGSPLSHATLLMADNPNDMREKILEREYPVCPPVTEANQHLNIGSRGEPVWINRFSFSDKKSSAKPKPRLLNHSALFALTRWTNLYFENDFVGGPINGVLGVGIQDKCLTAQKHGALPFQSHTKYWDADEPESVLFIQNSLRLRIPEIELSIENVMNNAV